MDVIETTPYAGQMINNYACGLHKDGNSTHGFETMTTAWLEDANESRSGSTLLPQLGVKLITEPNVGVTHCALTRWWHAGSSSRGVDTVSLVCGPLG